MYRSNFFVIENYLSRSRIFSFLRKQNVGKQGREGAMKGVEIDRETRDGKETEVR